MAGSYALSKAAPASTVIRTRSGEGGQWPQARWRTMGDARRHVAPDERSGPQDRDPRVMGRTSTADPQPPGSGRGVGRGHNGAAGQAAGPGGAGTADVTTEPRTRTAASHGRVGLAVAARQRSHPWRPGGELASADCRCARRRQAWLRPSRRRDHPATRGRRGAVQRAVTPLGTSGAAGSWTQHGIFDRQCPGPLLPRRDGACYPGLAEVALDLARAGHKNHEVRAPRAADGWGDHCSPR